MKDIKILGTGCQNCLRLEALVKETVQEMGLDARIDKVTDYADIVRWGVMSTPGLVIDGQVVSTGRIPSRRQLAELLAAS